MKPKHKNEKVSRDINQIINEINAIKEYLEGQERRRKEREEVSKFFNFITQIEEK